ncbi:hypothetical protein [Methylocapsa palsarum]|uniref:Uncharacterized protein n=1 Tax=Methylocapsa palsarum TaxID=1612308 RepID=A0A1I3VSX2_9HYPH|nr:hypothetical protein [Methylocapsa palsarum]SFJ97251.1 hypothetical protein SAMN05444581_10110 [Methylocapsa palsarum]
MRWRWLDMGLLALCAILALDSNAFAREPKTPAKALHARHVSGGKLHSAAPRLSQKRSYITYGAPVRGGWRGHGTGFADLVGDPESGLGFYALPVQYRIAARRYRLRHPRPLWQNPVYFAMMADAARYSYWLPANREYAYGIYNPYDGVGTPFFPGYYGPVGDNGEDRPLRTRPYRR